MRRWGLGGAFLLLLVGAVAVVGGWAQGGLLDDAYIFFRFAENIALGNGPRFNPSEPPVEGFTSPLWVGVLALLRLLGGNLERGAPLLGVSLAAVAALTAGLAARPREGGRVLGGLLSSVLLALTPAYSFWALTGMDACLFALAVAVLVFVVTREAPRMALLGLVVGLGAWVRLEMLYLGALVFLVRWAVLRPDWRRMLQEGSRCLATVLLVVVPQFLWRWLTFGKWLPNTFHAKVPGALDAQLAWGSEYLLKNVPSHAGTLLLAALSAWWLWRARDRMGLGLLVSAVGWLGYVLLVGGDHFAFGRFLVPAMVLVHAAAARAFVLLLETERRPLVPAGAAALAVAVASFGALRTEEARGARDAVLITQLWAVLGDWLRYHEPPGTRIATPVAGAIPYRSGMEAFDMLGLVTPSVIEEGRVQLASRPGHQRYSLDAFFRYQPDLLLFPTSGQFDEPLKAKLLDIDPEYFYSIGAVLRDPRMGRGYVGKAYRLSNGTWVELMRRKGHGDAGGASARQHP